MIACLYLSSQELWVTINLWESIAIKAGVDADDLILKVKSEEFGGRWVNLTEEDAVPDKSVIMCFVRTSKVCWCSCIIILKYEWKLCFVFLAPDTSPRYICCHVSYSNYVNTVVPCKWELPHIPKWDYRLHMIACSSENQWRMYEHC